MPTLDFNCCITYLTPAGRRKHSWRKVRAIAADIALEIAERQLRTDRRRLIQCIIYGEAIQV